LARFALRFHVHICGVRLLNSKISGRTSCKLNSSRFSHLLLLFVMSEEFV
jgi:hypothetical protein